MVNWKRVFESIWQHIRWLISYGQINELALKKILKKYTKNFFAIKDNTIKTRVHQIIESKHFKVADGSATQQELAMLSDSILQFYAMVFHDGNKNAARSELNAQHNQIRAKDSSWITFYSGLIFGMSLVLIIMATGYKDSQPNEVGWNSLFYAEDVYIFLYIITWIVIATGVCIMIFRRYSINYQFIFEID